MKRGIRKKRMFLLDLIKKHKPNRIGCEIGVYYGDFAEAIYKAIKPTSLYLIDPWVNIDIYFSVKRRFREPKNSSMSLKSILFFRNRAEDIYNRFENNLFDWIYLDADHKYASTEEILWNYWSKLKSGGLFIGDDYSIKIPYDKKRLPVKIAVDEFTTTKYIENEIKSYQILGDQYIITKA